MENIKEYSPEEVAEKLCNTVANVTTTEKEAIIRALGDIKCKANNRDIHSNHRAESKYTHYYWKIFWNCLQSLMEN